MPESDAQGVGQKQVVASRDCKASCGLDFRVQQHLHEDKVCPFRVEQFWRKMPEKQRSGCGPKAGCGKQDCKAWCGLVFRIYR